VFKTLVAVGQMPTATSRRTLGSTHCKTLIQRRSSLSYEAEIKSLIHNLDNRMGPSAYDTAWLARLRDPETQEPRWPELLEQLLATQHADGSWGGDIFYYHDRVICTLAAVIALKQNGHGRSNEYGIRRAERFLWRNLHLLPHDPSELVAFELILPTLLGEAHQIGLDTPTHTCGYGKIQTEKLQLIPPELLYSPRLSTALSLEFLGTSANVDQLRGALTVNGSLGNSPAATAYYLSLAGRDPRAMRYLESVKAHLPHITPIYPFRIFERTWVLNSFTSIGMPIRGLMDEKDWRNLQDEATSAGVGFDHTFGVADGDTSSVYSRVLLAAGYDLDTQILTQYQDEERHLFRTYYYERNPSVSTNVHALEALNLMDDFPNRAEVQTEIITMLLDRRKYGTFWVDKWHASPFYATSHTLVALLNTRPYLASGCQQTVDWITHMQAADGSWGYFGKGTVEETAFALTALLHYRRHRPVDDDILHRGAAYLAQHYIGGMSLFPSLWIVKCLYSPTDIIRSVVLAALVFYENTFGRAP